MAKEVWEKVKEAEAKAAKAIEDAKLQSIQIVKKAREDAAELIKVTEGQSVAKGETLLAERVTQAKDFKKNQVRKVDEELKHLFQTCAKRTNGAVNLILEKVVR